MDAALHDLGLWDRISDSERIDLAQKVERSLPRVRDVELVPTTPGCYTVRPCGPELPVMFHSVNRFNIGDQTHTIAQYVMKAQEDRIFSLIPGGTVQLGYDRQSTRFPTSEQERVWRETYEPDNFLPLRQEIDRVFTPRRSVILSPFLIEVAAVGRPRFIECVEHDEVGEALSTTGFRLPSSDEWEYAYSGGARCIFPWGNDPSPPTVFKANAFGLIPPESPYYWEFCADPTLMRGGDGGVSSCGGWGGLVEAITSACAFFDILQTEPWRAHFRRAVSLAH